METVKSKDGTSIAYDRVGQGPPRVVVAPAGFEPAISALRGLRPRPLDDGATFLVGGVGVEPTTSRV
jgi:hypothetical protein